MEGGSKDDDVTALLKRTRAARERVNSKLSNLGETAHPIRSPLRSPLKERMNTSPVKTPSRLAASPSKIASPAKLNSSALRQGSPTRQSDSPVRQRSQLKRDESPVRERSPLKSQDTNSPLRSRSPLKRDETFSVSDRLRSVSPGKRQVTSTTSPTRSSTVTTYKSPVKTNETCEKGNDYHKETFNREVTEKKTTIDHSPVRDSKGVETYKKTVVTEKEETISKTEVLKVTEVGKAGSKLGADIDPIKLLEERRSRRRQVAFDDKDKVHEISIVDSPSVSVTPATPVSPKASVSSRSMGSPSRFGSCRDLSPEKDNGWTPNKTGPNYRFSTDPEREDKNDGGNVEEEDDQGTAGGAAGRKKRLRALASKFKEYDEDEEEIVSAKLVADAAVTQSSPDKRNQTKIVDVDREIETSPRRGRSPTKRQANPHLFQSLKAQGYQESDSKSKLVYDFDKGSSSSPSKPLYRSNSPVKTGGDSSPFNPHQFIAPQKQQQQPQQKTSPMKAAPSATGPAYRSTSPTRMLDPGKSSTFTPHPLQFVSPKLAKEQNAPAPAPPKPQRVFSTDRDASTTEPQTSVADQTANKSEQSDTASRRSMAEKRNMFESASPSKESGPSQDPALLPLSQRRALFDKNRGVVVKPVARFGESVTPAMLAKTPSDPPVRKAEVPASEPAWKRKREVSPIRGSATPKAAPSSRSSPTKDLASIHKRFENSRKLFGREGGTGTVAEGVNDIARATAEAREKDMELLRSRFKRTNEAEEKPKTPEKTSVEQDTYYPGVNSLKKIKVSPPKNGQMYPDLNDIYATTDSDRDRPETAMSGESAAVSEAPSLGTAIKRVASTSVMSVGEGNKMPMINEDAVMDDSTVSGSVNDSDQINDMLDEALDVSVSPSRSMASTSRLVSPTRSSAARLASAPSPSRASAKSPKRSPNRSPNRLLRNSPIRHSAAMAAAAASSEDSEDAENESRPTPPKSARLSSASSSEGGSSAASWEYSTPQTTLNSRHRGSCTSESDHDFKTPLVADIGSPSSKQALPCVETEDGEAKPAQDLMYTVSFYRKQKPSLNVQVTPHAKIVRNSSVNSDDEAMETEKDKEEDLIAARIRKLQEEVDEQTQRRLQSSKALDVCASKNEFEGSFERVEFERLLLEAHHKHSAASAEIRRLKTEGARRMSMSVKGGNGSPSKPATSKGAISISGITLPLKPDFVRMLNTGGHDGVHYFLCLVKYRAQVIATQMLSTTEGITRGSNLVFSNLINVNDLDFDFQIYLEVYGLQTPKERLSHEAKYHIIRKGKSMFNLTPLKKLKRSGHGEGSGASASRNPVNSLSIRKSKFGLVGYATITIDNLANKTFILQQVPSRSPLEGDLAMELNVHSECHIEERGFLTLFMDVNGFGNWCRRWTLLQDNTLYFWKYPEDEGKRAPSEQISLHNVVTETPVSLAPRDICSRFNTFMLESQRAIQSGDKDALNIVSVDAKRGLTNLRYLLSADTRDERLNWCTVLTRTLENMRAWDPTTYRSRSSSTSTVATASSLEGASTVASDTMSAASSVTDIW